MEILLIDTILYSNIPYKEEVWSLLISDDTLALPIKLRRYFSDIHSHTMFVYKQCSLVLTKVDTTFFGNFLHLHRGCLHRLGPGRVFRRPRLARATTR